MRIHTLTEESLYSEEKKRRRVPGVMKEGQDS
jgi:hypothetical protein